MSVHTRKLLLICAGIAGVLSLTAAMHRPSADPTDVREVARLRRHFAVVLSELRAADATSLSTSQRTARTTLIARLEQYAAAGRFPHNHVVPGKRVPVFRDEHGTMCAMAYLIASTGHNDIVEYVARRNNLAYIPQLAGDVRLRAWLDSTGLTVAEAARVQPSYGGGICLCPSPSPPPAVNRVSDAYFAASALATIASGGSLIINLAARDMTARTFRRTAAVGLVAGAGQFVLGAFAIRERGVGGFVAGANMAIGASSLVGSAWRLQHLPQPQLVSHTVSIAPMISGRRNAGVVISARM